MFNLSAKIFSVIPSSSSHVSLLNFLKLHSLHIPRWRAFDKVAKIVNVFQIISAIFKTILLTLFYLVLVLYITSYLIHDIFSKL